MTRRMGPGEHNHSSRGEGGESLSPEVVDAGQLSTKAAIGTDGYHPQSPTAVYEVVDGSMVDVGFATEHPKEAATTYYAGTFYMAVAVWDAYDSANLTDKETVLMASEDPLAGWEQVSRVTDNAGVFMHAPDVLVDDDGELWVFVSDKTGGGNDIHAYHQPHGNIGANAADWTDEGVVWNSARDPGIQRDSQGYVMHFTDEANGSDVSYVESTDLVNWGGHTANVYTEADANRQGPIALPAGDGSDEWWLLNTGYDGSTFYEVFGTGNSLRGNFSGVGVACTVGSIQGIRKPFYSDWTSHYAPLLVGPDREPGIYNGGLLCFFEGGDGSNHHVGAVSLTADGLTGPYGARFDRGRGTNGTSQALPSAETTIIYDVVRYDDRLEYDETTGVFTADKGGIYRAAAGVKIDGVGDGDRCYLFARKNAGTASEVDVAGDQNTAAAAAPAQVVLNFNTTVQLAAGDTFEIVANQTSGAQQSIPAGTFTYGEVTRIR